MPLPWEGRDSFHEISQNAISVRMDGVRGEIVRVEIAAADIIQKEDVRREIIRRIPLRCRGFYFPLRLFPGDAVRGHVRSRRVGEFR